MKLYSGKLRTEFKWLIPFVIGVSKSNVDGKANVFALHLTPFIEIGINVKLKCNPVVATDYSAAQKLFTKHNPNDGFIQWKGTDVCMDFHCDCGWHNHYHGYFAYEVECFQCGEVFAPSCSVEMLKVLSPGQSPLQDVADS